MSDHKPVSADFTIKVSGQTSALDRSVPIIAGSPKVKADAAQDIVRFGKMSEWKPKGKNTVLYTLPKGFEAGKDDYVGVYNVRLEELRGHRLNQY